MTTFLKLFIVSFVFLSTIIFCSQRTEDVNNPYQVNITHKVLTDDLTHPWEILWGPDNYIWMTERDGRISRVNPANGDVQPIYTIPDVQSNGEGGLLGMALHPSFSSNPSVYVSYNYSNGGNYQEKIVRYTYNGTTLTNPQTIIDGINASGIHNGSRLLIKEDKLFVTTRDAANPSSAQNKTLLNGKILRLNLDGSVPADNPIQNTAVWSWGHRNAQGLVFVGNQLFSTEHGASADDEINIIERGRNFGWPNVEGGCNTASEQTFCSENNVKPPVEAWTPTIAVCGMDYYDNAAIPQWKNSLLVTTLKNSRLYQLKLNGNKTNIIETNEFLNRNYGRLRDVCISPGGAVYICTSNGSNDKIIKITAE